MQLQRDIATCGEVVFHIRRLNPIEPNLEPIPYGDDLEVVPLPLLKGALRRFGVVWRVEEATAALLVKRA